MISTVTVSTAENITSTLAGPAALIGIVVLFVLLLQKEITTASDKNILHRLGTVLNIGIIPLLIVFVLILISNVLEVLR